MTTKPLYLLTESQVSNLLAEAWVNGANDDASSIIELPPPVKFLTDEEINRKAYAHDQDTENSFSNEESYRLGAIEMRDEILKQIKL